MSDFSQKRYYWYNMENGGWHISLLTPQEAERRNLTTSRKYTMIPVVKNKEK